MARFLESLKTKLRKSRSPSPNPVSTQASSATTSQSPPVTVDAHPAPATPPQPAAPESESEVKSQSIAERLWNKAYDEIKADEHSIVDEYERILSSALGGSVTFDAASHDNVINQTPNGRSDQMRQLVDAGLEKTKKIASAEKKVEDGLATVKLVQGIVGKALEAAPQAAVAWVGVCLALEIITNPVTEASAHRSGIEYIVNRMDWYWNLAELLLDENRSDKSSTALRDELEKHLVDLYKKLLLYQIRSVCIFYRNQFGVFLRNTIKLDNWEEERTRFEEAEELIRKDSAQFNTEQVKSHLQSIRDHLTDQTASHAKQTELLEQQLKLQQEYSQIRQGEGFRKCLNDLRETNPHSQKILIQETKGGLLHQSYAWILDDANFRRWRDDDDYRLLWVKADPGKGKMMLLCGLIDEMKQSRSKPLSYFLCQATELRLSSATAVLRGLIYLLVDQLPSLVSYISYQYDREGKQMFEDAASFWTLSKILKAMLDDPKLDGAVLVVDALDECMTHRPELLDLITDTSNSSKVKWLVSSRNWPDIEDKLDKVTQKIKLQLESNSIPIRNAVSAYINHKVTQLAKEKKYGDDLKSRVEQHLRAKSGDTFLWVALVCQQLADPRVKKWRTIQKLESFPQELSSLYKRMIEQLSELESEDEELCRDILGVMSVTYRAITLQELVALTKLLPFEDDMEALHELISTCGSFLTVRGDCIYFVHQSAKEFLNESCQEVFSRDVPQQHNIIFSRSLNILSKCLHQDMYNLKAPGVLINEIDPPEPNPLASCEYSCTYWVDHLCDSAAGKQLIDTEALQNDGIVHVFFKEKYVFWLESLSLLHKMPEGIMAMRKLQAAVNLETLELTSLLWDALRFVLSFGSIIEQAPLQVYVSALTFSPSGSKVKQLFSHEEPGWITTKANIAPDWDPCLQTLEGHSECIYSLALSPDDRLLASGAGDGTVRIWDCETGACLHTLGPSAPTDCTSIAFSTWDGSHHLAILTGYEITIFDTTGTCLTTIQLDWNDTAQTPSLASSPSQERRVLASASHNEGSVKIWDVTTGECTSVLQGHARRVLSLAFSPAGDCMLLATGSSDNTVRLWDAAKGIRLRTLTGHLGKVWSVAFSPLKSKPVLASGSGDGTVRIWDPETGDHLHTMETHDNPIVRSVSFSHSGHLASASADNTIRLWDTSTWTCIKTIHSNTSHLCSAVVSRDGRVVIAGDAGAIIKIWGTTRDVPPPTIDRDLSKLIFLDESRFAAVSYKSKIEILDFSNDPGPQVLHCHSVDIHDASYCKATDQIALGCADGAIKLWNIGKEDNLQLFKGCNGSVHAVTFSQNGLRLASATTNLPSSLSPTKVTIWDTTQSNLTEIQTFGANGYYPVISLSPNGRLLVIPLGNELARLVDVESRNTVLEMKTLASPVSSAISEDSRYAAVSSKDKSRCKMNVYEVASGTCLLDLSLGAHVKQPKFSHEGEDLFLSTEFGMFQVLPRTKEADREGSPAQYHEGLGYGLSFDKTWVMKDGERLLRLPSEYRPRRTGDTKGTSVAVRGSTITIGGVWGQVYQLQLDWKG